MDKNKREIRTSHQIGELERREIIEEYLTTNISKAAIWRKYTGYSDEHAGLLSWMRQLGYADKPKNGSILLSIPTINPISLIEPEHLDDLTPKQYKQKIQALEKQLFESQLKAEAYLLTIEIAEKELKIPILKKPNTK